MREKVGDSDIDIHAKGGAANPGHCPYCHFALKAMSTIHCPTCGAGHHPECWAENGGCAIMGCGALASPAAAAPVGPPAPPPVPAAAAPPPAPAGARSPSLLVIAVIVAALGVAGAAIAVVRTRGQDAAPRAADAPPATVTIVRTAAGGEATTPATAVATTAGTPSGSAEGRLVVGAHYSVRIPAGFERNGPAVFHRARTPTESSFTESQWQSADDPNTYIHIDYTPGLTVSVGEAARGVRAAYHKSTTFREHSFASAARDDGLEAWRWHYSDTLASGVYVEKIDYFVGGCGTGYALLGVAPSARWPQIADTFDAAARSLKPRC